MLLWIVLAPLIGALINALVFASGFWKRYIGKDEDFEKKIVGLVGCGAIFISAVLSLITFIDLLSLDNEAREIIETVFVWIPSGSFSADFEFLFDPISAVMALVVTWVSFLIHVYSIGYMHGDKAYSRYFTYLNTFVFFMLVLILGNNFLLMFVGWEGVGLASYLLIGFWYQDSQKSSAGRKAFIVNRIGDFGFLLGILLIFTIFGSLTFQEVFSLAASPEFLATIPTGIITIIALLLFVGAVGKSAQFPLYVWLPDAMAGPTPVSALIHAATMVTAGVYMIARCSVFYSASPTAQMVVVSVAALTALLAATIAVTQNDIKKVLAYSTVSQLGFMFMAVGSGAYAAGMFHLVTHAFFKALLFLGAGSVIHSLHEEQDIRKMGGIRKDLPITSLTFLIGALAISGMPLLSGFFSKDEILASLYVRGYIIPWAIGLIAAVLTGFYMMRLYLLTFEGETRLPEKIKRIIHESPTSMWVPLVILAFLSIFAGYLGFPDSMGALIGLEHSNIFEGFLSSSLYGTHIIHTTENVLGHGMLILISIIIAFVGMGSAIFIYVKKPWISEMLSTNAVIKPLYTASYAKWFVDEIYNYFIVIPFKELSKFAADVDRYVVDGLVDGTGYVVRELGSFLRMAQTGLVRFYVGLMVLGTLAILIFMLSRAM